ncbi:MAG: TetR/AcrR family transcriptional regulator [Bacilli bacterium]|nr:TetR/AcrR family transcriptional regulator [Bacilli bacterium]MDD4077301.1 TetR/AcrR family transcriptional regulator [Bacilli bacterium]MDD4388413.1 TetR/AcrR family transcriptional regulator [Bacilli bacterium]
MPTKTFLNLPKEKKLRILRAAKKEFSRVPLDKAVIANIVKEADIPRGSFYQYFENVEDLFVYLIHYMYGIDKKKFIKYLKEADNDVYEALKLKFSHTIDKLTIEENRQFRLNIMSAIFNEKSTYDIVVPKIMEPGTEVDLAYFPLEVQKSKNSQSLLNIIKMIGKTCLEKYLIKAASEEEIKNNYNDYIDFVKFSFNKQ